MLVVNRSEQEKRRYARVPVELDVNVSLIQDGRPVVVDAILKDLSYSGLGLKWARRLKLVPGQPVEIAAGSCAGVEAKVQWVDHRGVGIHITQGPDRVAKSWVGHVLGLQGHAWEN